MISQVRPAHADHARSRAGTGPGSEGLPASGATPAGLYGGAISCRRRFSTDTILSASGIAENASDVARKTSFGAAGSFQGGRERHPFKIAPDRRPDSLDLRPTSRWSAAFAAESRVEVRRPDTQGVAQIVRREVLAPKQQYGDLERRVTRLGRARSDTEHAFDGSSLSKP